MFPLTGSKTKVLEWPSPSSNSESPPKNEGSIAVILTKNKSNAKPHFYSYLNQIKTELKLVL